MASSRRSSAYADTRSTNASARKMGASGSERRTERSTTTTRESYTVRTRSPVKSSKLDQLAGSKRSRDGEKLAPSRAEERRSHVEEPKGKQGLSRAARNYSTSSKSRYLLCSAWNPQASIIQHSTAPLASRMSVPPLASSAPLHLQPQPLNQLSLEQQEKAVIEDLLLVFMGFEGLYIRFVESYDPLEEKERLVGPAFRILPGLDPSLRDLTSSMLKMATHYISIEAFIEVQSRQEYGAVSHALCATIRKLLQEYLILMAQLETQMLTNPDFTLHVLNLQIRPTSHMLFQLYNLAIELLKANSILEDDAEDSLDSDSDDVENILESLRDGGQGVLRGKKVCKGGSVLGLITRRLASMAGDPAARALLTNLLREASRPYMNMLNEWLHHGGIRDPHGEFLIRESRSIKRERLDEDYTDEYWEKRYTITESVVPPQLDGVKEKVLLAGKYLNVVRECGGVDISKEVRDVPTTFDDARFLENVNNAYAYANSSLLKLLLTTHALPQRLRSLKHYFFLDRSDFFTYFLELGHSELRKPFKEANVGKLQSLLDIVLRQPGSVAADDPFKEDVKVVMNDSRLTNWLMKIVNVTGLDQDPATGALAAYTPAAPTSSESDSDLNGFDALVLDYTVPFPLSLVVSRVTLTRYQLLFRYLLSLRHLETSLITSWTDHAKVFVWKHRSRDPRIERCKRRAWTLRARMLVFVQQLIYYSTAEVIEPNWTGLMTRLQSQAKASEGESSENPGTKRTVDELMQDHVDFLATCLKECMLTNAKLLKINSRILSTCTKYASFTSSIARYLQAGDRDLTSTNNNNNNNNNRHSSATNTSSTRNASSSTAAEYDPSRIKKLQEALDMFEHNFSRHLKILLDTLNYLAATETVVFLSLCARLSTATASASGDVVGGGATGPSAFA